MYVSYVGDRHFLEHFLLYHYWVVCTCRLDAENCCQHFLHVIRYFLLFLHGMVYFNLLYWMIVLPTKPWHPLLGTPLSSIASCVVLPSGTLFFFFISPVAAETVRGWIQFLRPFSVRARKKASHIWRSCTNSSRRYRCHSTYTSYICFQCSVVPRPIVIHPWCHN